MEKTMPAKKTYQPPMLTKHQRLQKVTLGTVTPGPPVSPGSDWLAPRQ